MKVEMSRKRALPTSLVEYFHFCQFPMYFDFSLEISSQNLRLTLDKKNDPPLLVILILYILFKQVVIIARVDYNVSLLHILFFLLPTFPRTTGCNPDSSHRGCWHACSHHGAEQLLWLGSLCWGLPARKQPLNNCRCSDWLLRCHPLLHHVRGE